MRNYQQYSTALKLCYAIGLQREFVDEKTRKKIPRSTSVEWKKMRASEIIGAELDHEISRHLEELKLLLHPAANVPRKVTVTYVELIQLLMELFGKHRAKRVLRMNKQRVVEFAEKAKGVVSSQEIAACLGFSAQTLSRWKTMLRFMCGVSPLGSCLKRRSNQATPRELKIIQQWLTKEEFAHWGVHSVWAKAFKEGATKLSVGSWRYYNSLLNFRGPAIKGKKPKPSPSIRAERVNQIWHADITVFLALDGCKYYIYTVMDNFSRYIISWRIEKVVSADFRLKTIEDAMRVAFKDGEVASQVRLITDGGPENDNLIVKEFIRQNKAAIEHAIALKDIRQSNSMMEAFYHTTKYRCLYRYEILNYDQLVERFTAWIEEYHHQKPHYALGIYTPAEVYNGADKFEKFGKIYKEGAEERREANRNATGCDRGC